MEFEEPNSTPPRLSLFSQRFNKPEADGSFSPPPHTGATIPFQWEETPGKPRTTTATDLPLQTSRSLDLPPRMFISSSITTPTNSMFIASPKSVLELDGISFSSPGKSKWKKMMPLRKMITSSSSSSSSGESRSWSWGAGSSSWSFGDEVSNSFDCKSKINKLSNKTCCIIILESMNQSIIQAVPWRR